MISPQNEDRITEAAALLKAGKQLEKLINAVGARDVRHVSVIIEYPNEDIDDAAGIPKDVMVLGLHTIAEEIRRRANVLVATIQASATQPNTTVGT